MFLIGYEAVAGLNVSGTRNRHTLLFAIAVEHVF
jgi:hypothetical protein